MTNAHDTKTVDGLMGMFYNGACERGTVVDCTAIYGAGGIHFDLQFSLTAKQFAWLADVERREMHGIVAPTSARGRTITGRIAGVGAFTAHERRYGSAIVNVKKDGNPAANHTDSDGWHEWE